MAQIYRRGRIYYCDLRSRGRRVRKALGPDKRVAQLRLAELISQQQADRHNYGNRDMAWSDFCKQYLAHSRATKAANTARLDGAAITALGKIFPLTRLAQLTPHLLERFKSERVAAPATVNRELRALKAMLRRAAEWGLTSQDPSGVRLMREPKGHPAFYSAEELRAILDSCEGHYLTIALLGSRAGLRRSEMYWLNTRDIYGGNIHVIPKDGWTTKSGKTRKIPLAPEISKHLRGRRGWVIPRPDVAAPSAHTRNMLAMSRGFGTIIRRLGLSGGIHSLRHTFASHLALAGVPLFVIADLLGHSTARVTEVYAHLQPSTAKAAIKKLPRL